MAKVSKTQNTKNTTKTARPVGRPPRAKTVSQKLDDLKLGKFAECEPMCLPDKQVRRGWQILGAVILLLLALVGGYFMLMTEPLKYMTWAPSVMSPMAVISSTPGYWLMVEVAVLILVVCAVVAAIVLLFGKNVPAIFWYLMIGAGLVALIFASFHRFRLYEQRQCYKNYPNIVEFDYACPSVVNELGAVVLMDILLFAAGMIAIILIHKAFKCRLRHNVKR